MKFPEIPGYRVLSLLGRGAFGVVYEAVWEDGFHCAVKVLEEGALHREYLASVLERLAELPLQEGLLPFYAYDLTDGTPHLSMALLEGAVTFDDLTGKLTREESWELLRQLADTLAWLHGHGLVHAGLTGGNVFVVAEEDGTARAILTDMGQAWVGDGTMDRLHDQAPYVPPERWLDPARVLQDGHAETWDIYAFGVLAWRLLNGRWPRANSLFNQVLAAKAGRLEVDAQAFAEWLQEEPDPVWPRRALDPGREQAREMLLRCVSLDPQQRPVSMLVVAQAFSGQAVNGQAQPETEAPAELPSPALPPEIPSAVAPEVLSEAFNAEAAPVLPDTTAEPRSASLLEDLPETTCEAIPDPSAAPEPPEPTIGAPVFPDPFLLSRPIALAGPPEAAPQDEAAAISPWQPVALETNLPDPEALPDVFRPLQPAPEVHAMPAAEVPQGSTIARRLAIAASLAVGLAGGFSALQHKAEAERSQAELATLRTKSTIDQNRASQAEQKNAALEKEQADLRLASLKQSRDEWANVVSAMLGSRPSDSAQQEAWKSAVAPVAERLNLALSAADGEPSLAMENLAARSHLAAVYSALDRKEDALPLLERVSQELEALAASGKALSDEQRLMNARTAARRGAILLENRKAMEAAPLLQAASKAYEAWLPGHAERHEIAREYAENSLLEGRALLERHLPSEARTAFTRISGLLGSAGDAGFLSVDQFTLSDGLMELSALDSAEGKLEPAIEHHMEAIRLLVAYDQSNRQSVVCRRRLADGYYSLGRLLTKNGTPRDASVAFNEAVKILTELTTESPSEPCYQLQLALTYNEVAQLLRASKPNAAGAQQALDFQNFSVSYLRHLNETNTLDNTYRNHLAGALVLNGELQEAAGETKAALSRHTEALAILDELLADNSLSDADRKECRRLSARAWTATGGMQEKSGSKDDAISSLSKALEAWTGFASDNPAAAQNVASTRERLRKLKPAG
jgi:serine/threonine protein kinase